MLYLALVSLGIQEIWKSYSMISSVSANLCPFLTKYAVLAINAHACARGSTRVYEGKRSRVRGESHNCISRNTHVLRAFRVYDDS